jgi:hypothetical protein
MVNHFICYGLKLIHLILIIRLNLVHCNNLMILSMINLHHITNLINLNILFMFSIHTYWQKYEG